MDKSYVKSQVREWTESIIIAVILALLIRTFVVQAFKIPSGSMIPTFNIGDRIFVSKFIYGAKVPLTNFSFPAIRQPKAGDIIVFRSPDDPRKDFVKRLIGTGGDEIKINDGKVFINGKAFEMYTVDDIRVEGGNVYKNGKLVEGAERENALARRGMPRQVEYFNYLSEIVYGREGGVIHVPKEHYFVLGDNSASSRDSRYWGFVPRKNLIGKAIFIYWPFYRMKVIK